MKVVLDTNVLISGFLTSTGISQYAFHLALKRHAVILSEFILHELEEKLTSKIEAPRGVIDAYLHILRTRTTVLQVPENSEIRFEDKNDIPILSLVEFSKAHYLVTGDKKMLELKKFGTSLIVNPREAAEVL